MAHGTKKSIDMANYYKEKTGIEIISTESFDVNVCKKEIYKIIN